MAPVDIRLWLMFSVTSSPALIFGSDSISISVICKAFEVFPQTTAYFGFQQLDLIKTTQQIY